MDHNHHTLIRGLLIAGVLAARTVWAAGAADVVGTWNLKMTEGERTVEPTLTLNEHDGHLTGEWSGPRGPADLEDAKFENGTLSASFSELVEMREVPLQFTATVDGNTLTGKVITARGDLPVTGVRGTAGTGTDGKGATKQEKPL